MTLVIDASVVVKWLLKDPEREADTEKATQLMRQVADGLVQAVQPAHWLLEVGAVLSRISPATAEDDLTMLQALDIPTEDNPIVLRRACRLAIDLRQHLFDTVYHAIALETPDTTLVTADDKYWRAANALGQVVRLQDWRMN